MEKKSVSGKRKAVGKRANDAQLNKRIDAVMQKLIDGDNRTAILEFARVQWNIERAQADNYIAEATKLIKAEAAKDREETFGEHIAYRRKLRKMAEGDKDWRAALASAQDEAKLLDLYPADKLKGEIRHTHITFDVRYDDDPGGTEQSIHDPSAPPAPAPA